MRHRAGLSAAYLPGWGRGERPRPQAETAAPPEVAASCYVELHCHSAFSLREGASTPEELLLRAKALGYAALAITDHDSLAGAMQFTTEAVEKGLQAIIGAEITLADESHLTLLCESPRGYANLSRLLTRANLSSPRGEPRVSFEWLAEHSEGLIALSGCRKGEVAALAERGETRAAVEAAVRYRDVFGGENYFIELQENLVYEDETRNDVLVALARELGIGVVATNNVHYHAQAAHRVHDVLVAVRHHTNLEEARPYLRANAEFYLKPPAEMERLFAHLPEAIENTARIAERCRGFDLKRDLSYEFPDYDSGDGRDADAFLKDTCYRLARDHYCERPFQELPDNVEERLKKELHLIKASKRAGFFLRLWDILSYAHDNGLPVRGRGSSVGSLVCFLLGLSGIDPIRYDLAVERFLSEDRPLSDVPDVDLDFGREARDRMFRHVFEKYGTEYSAMVCTFIEYRYASAIRDAGKALGLPESEIDKIAKRMHSRFAEGLEEELASMPEFASRMRFPIWRDFLMVVNQLLGLPRHLSQHSGGIIISSSRMDEQVPVEAAAMDGRFICQWDKDSVADAGFIKLDFLGYPSLDQLRRGLGYVKERYGRDIDPKSIRLDDEKVYEMIQRGDVLGIVQIQSRAQIQVLLRIKVSRIEDMIIQVALIRPGPIQGGAVHPYIARCLGQEEVTYDHPSLEPVLEETKGVFVFQEQVIQATMKVAGFTSLQSDKFRRAMSRKRSYEEMNKQRDDFLDGAVSNGVSRRTAESIFEKLQSFASFGFPKSHAAAMAVTAFHVAWLKLYYPAEFYCALLNEQPMGFYTPEVIANDARRHDIEIRGVDVRRSAVECLIEDDLTGNAKGAVRLGYRYVKGLAEAAYRRLEAERVNGEYRSLWDFWRRTHLSREAIENLISIGAFAWTGLHERELLWQLGTFYRPLNGQQPLAMLPAETLPSLDALSAKERIVTDLLITGIAVRGRSMDLVADQLHEGITPSRLVNEMQSGQKVTVGGLVAVRQSPETAKGFVFHTLEDYDGLMNVITAPSLIPKFRHLIESAPALIVHGHIERQERSVNVIAERFEALPIVSDAERRVHNFG
ncbi:MAG TPA: DNA polymerase III subunit alpha [Dehalococcoidia bacterium]|nr:DNA polymerase III subunit alpha [Dehalococcoidia bacterium]